MMHPLRRQRLIAVGFIVVLATAAAVLLVYALGQNINLFYTPSQVVAGQAPVGTQIRIGGMVVEDSVSRAPNTLDTSFLVTDGAGEVRVTYAGILPDLFAEGEAAVATGEVLDDGTFKASQVLAKHDESYTPKEVTEAMEKAMEQAREARDDS